MSEWIPMSQEYPCECDCVLLWDAHFDPIVGYIIHDVNDNPLLFVLNDLDEGDVHFKLDDFTHWMELPEPPNE